MLNGVVMFMHRVASRKYLLADICMYGLTNQQFHGAALTVTLSLAAIGRLRLVGTPPQSLFLSKNALANCLQIS